jgi:hypothetical protein
MSRDNKYLEDRFTFIVRPYYDNSEPRVSFQFGSSVLGWVKGTQMFTLQTGWFWKLLVVVDWWICQMAQFSNKLWSGFGIVTSTQAKF